MIGCIYFNLSECGTTWKCKMYSLPAVKHSKSYQCFFKHNIINTLTISTTILGKTQTVKIMLFPQETFTF